MHTSLERNSVMGMREFMAKLTEDSTKKIKKFPQNHKIPSKFKINNKPGNTFASRVTRGGNVPHI